MFGGGGRDQYTREGPASKITNSIGSFFVGLLVVFLTCGWIFDNENNLVMAEETANVVESASEVHDCTPGSRYDSQLVYAECNLDSPAIGQQLPQAFQSFIPEFKGAEISWIMELYQWIEQDEQSSHKNNDGSTTTRHHYTYKQEWSMVPINSNSFRQQNYVNFGQFPTNVEKTGNVKAEEYSLIAYGRGQPKSGYALDERMTGQIPESSIKPESAGGQAFHSQYAGGDLNADALYVQGDYLQTVDGTPRIGDLRISFHGRTAEAVSICGKQEPSDNGGSGNGPAYMLTEWPPQVFDFWGRKTYELEKLYARKMNKEQFIDLYHKENQGTAMLFRIGLFILMLFACSCVWAPCSAVADLSMYLNQCTCGIAGSFIDAGLQAGICCASCTSACVVFFVVFVVSWMAVHPTYAVLLAAAAGGAVYFYQQKANSKSAKGRELAAECYIKIDGV